jgi:cysteine desulfurase
MRAIYLDHNATTAIRPAVARAMQACLEGAPGNPSSRHRFGRDASAARDRAREEVAAAAGCDAGEVIFTSGGTEADNIALRGLLGPDRRHMITAATEHEAILHTAHDLRDNGIDVTVLPVDAEGRVDPAAVEAALRPDTAVVSVMTANNETGVLHDIAAIGAHCRARGVLFHTDAVQAFGKIPFRFRDWPLDLASLSAHKIGGPKGIGALLVRSGVAVRGMVTGGGQERQIRPGTENLPGIVGFGVAARMAVENLEAEVQRLEILRNRLEEGILAAVPCARANGEGAARLPNTSNLTFCGLNGEDLLIALDLEGVAVSTGAACNAGASDPSHVLLSMGRTRGDAAGSIRYPLGAATGEDEIEEVLRLVPGIAARQAAAGATP